MSHLTTLDHAQQFVASGLSVIPIKCDGSKSPAIASWKPFQQRPPTDQELSEWFDRPQPAGIGLVGGFGGLTVLDVDDADYSDAVCFALRQGWPYCWSAVAVVDTPRPGRQILMRTIEPPSCQKLAHRFVASSDKDIEAFVECKAVGGYVVTIGSPVEVHRNKTLYQQIHGCPIYKLPVVDQFYANKVLDVGRLFNQVEFERTEHSTKRSRDEAPRPGDVYDLHADWKALLIRAGWSPDHADGDVEFWRRPGKHVGHSATLGYLNENGVRLLSIFSTSLSYGPRDGKPTVLTPFEFLSLDVYRGDWAQAALEAVEQFGPQIDAAQAAWRSTRASVDSIQQLSAFEPQPVDWIWPGFIAKRKSTMLSGREGVGKSFLFIDLASRITTGRTWPCGTPNDVGAGTVVLLSSEDDAADTFRPRFDAAEANVDNVLIVPMSKRVGDGPPEMVTILDDISRTMESSRQLVDQLGLPPMQLLIVDPITGFLGDADANSSGGVRSVMATLQDVAHRHGVAVVALNHHGKDHKRGVDQRYLGSTSFRAAVRTAIDVLEDPRQPGRIVMALTKSNISEKNRAMAFKIIKAGLLDQSRRVDWEPEVFEFKPADFAPEDGRKAGKDAERQELHDYLQLLIDDPSETWPKRTTDFHEELCQMFNLGKGIIAPELRKMGFTSTRSLIPGENHFVTEPPPGDDDKTEAKQDYPDCHATTSSNCAPGKSPDLDNEVETSPAPLIDEVVWKDRQDSSAALENLRKSDGLDPDIEAATDPGLPSFPQVDDEPEKQIDEQVRQDRQDQSADTDGDDDGGFILGGEDSDDEEGFEWV